MVDLICVHTKRQLHIRIRPADGCPTPRRRDAILPADDRTRRIRGDDGDRAVGERVAKHIRNVVPDLVVAVERVRKVRLWTAVVQAVGRAGDLDGDAACTVVLPVSLRVVLAQVDCLAGADGRSHRPKVDRAGAVVVDDGIADGVGQGEEGSDAERGEELHD